MVKLDRIYTRGGDGGETSLGDGSRRKKYDLRVAAYGALDEVNAFFGMIHLEAKKLSDERNEFQRITKVCLIIQNDLFDLGADLCVPETSDGKKPKNRLRLAQDRVEWLEGECDHFNEALAPLTSFILPGGTALASWLHIARTVVRRAERLLVELSESESINKITVKYVNRLSDLLFLLARAANNNGKDDILWCPGAGIDASAS